MDVKKYEDLLALADLNKKEFAELIGKNYQTVRGWGHPKTIPFWVKSWLENYINSKKVWVSLGLFGLI